MQQRLLNEKFPGKFSGKILIIFSGNSVNKHCSTLILHTTSSQPDTRRIGRVKATLNGPRVQWCVKWPCPRRRHCSADGSVLQRAISAGSQECPDSQNGRLSRLNTLCTQLS